MEKNDPEERIKVMKNKNKREKKQRIFAILCAGIVAVALLLSIIVPIASAVSQEELDNAKEKTEDAKKDLENAEGQYDDFVAQYNAVDQQISDIEYEISTLEAEILKTKNDIFICEEELKAAQAAYDEQQDLFEVRARAMYENTGVDYLEILFGANDFGDFLSKMEVVSQIVKYDNNILGNLQEAKDLIVQSRKELEDTLARQEENMKTLEDKKTSLNAALDEKNSLCWMLNRT